MWKGDRCCGTAMSGRGAGEERTGGAPEDEDGAAERFSPDGPIRLTDGSGAAANGAVAAQPASDG